LLQLASSHRAFVTVEENVVAGGAGSAIAECLAVHGHSLSMLHLGIPDRFIEHGSRDECLAMAGLDATSVDNAISHWWKVPARAAAS
jgi:1-deoxy-D-xylulose-5-phosphate synthase